jgi:predicted RNase H-like HicB family nuclease
MRYYIGLIHKDADSDYGVSFPDLPGCVSAGRTLDEARSMAAEALALHLEGLAADGAEIPPPSSLEVVMADQGYRDGVATLIPAPTAEGERVRVNVVLPQDVLADADHYAAAHGVNRSEFIARAIKHELERAG